MLMSNPQDDKKSANASAIVILTIVVMIVCF